MCFYTKDSSVFSRLVLLSVNTLASIPSIIYGLFGYLAFVIFCGFKISFISGVLTLSIMCLPVVLASSLVLIVFITFVCIVFIFLSKE